MRLAALITMWQVAMIPWRRVVVSLWWLVVVTLPLWVTLNLQWPVSTRLAKLVTVSVRWRCGAPGGAEYDVAADAVSVAACGGEHVAPSQSFGPASARAHQAAAEARDVAMGYLAPAQRAARDGEEIDRSDVRDGGESRRRVPKRMRGIMLPETSSAGAAVQDFGSGASRRPAGKRVVRACHKFDM